MDETTKQIIGYVAPMVGLFLIVLLFWVIKLLMDRQKYAKKADNHILAMVMPDAGKWKNYLVPIENVGGVPIVKIPAANGKLAEHSPIHILGTEGEFPVDYPIGKTHFVQATIQGVFYHEGDIEPISNVTDRPSVSAQLLTNLIDGVGAAAEQAMKKSQEASEGKPKKSGMIWLYVLCGAGAALSIAILVLVMKNSGTIESLATIVKKALGVQ